MRSQTKKLLNKDKEKPPQQQFLRLVYSLIIGEGVIALSVLGIVLLYNNIIVIVFLLGVIVVVFLGLLTNVQTFNRYLRRLHANSRTPILQSIVHQINHDTLSLVYSLEDTLETVCLYANQQYRPIYKMWAFCYFYTKAKKDVTTIRKSLRRISSLIEVYQSKSAFHSCPVQSAVLDAVQQTVGKTSENTQVSLIYPRRVFCDFDDLVVCFSILLSNSNKYQDNFLVSEVKIICHRCGNKIQIDYTDNSWGIPEQFYQYVFKKPFRGHSYYSGAGYGLERLAIILKRNNAKISFNPVENGIHYTLTFLDPHEL